MKAVVFIFFACVVFTSCDIIGAKKGAFVEGVYEYIPLEEYKYTAATIKDGSSINILSFSGGKMCDEKNLYYVQFIAIDSLTNDTVRIFSACTTYQEDFPRTGSFNNTTSNDAAQQLVEKGLQKNGKNQYVVFNKDNAGIEKGNYKTTFGTVGFKFPNGVPDNLMIK